MIVALLAKTGVEGGRGGEEESELLASFVRVRSMRYFPQSE